MTLFQNLDKTKIKYICNLHTSRNFYWRKKHEPIAFLCKVSLLYYSPITKANSYFANKRQHVIFTQLSEIRVFMSLLCHDMSCTRERCASIILLNLKTFSGNPESQAKMLVDPSFISKGSATSFYTKTACQRILIFPIAYCM